MTVEEAVDNKSHAPARIGTLDFRMLFVPGLNSIAFSGKDINLGFSKNSPQKHKHSSETKF
jgi:hypothetical protein